jgi:hypothetical protein
MSFGGMSVSRIATFGLGISPRPRKGATVAAITCRSAARPEPIRGAKTPRSGAGLGRNQVPLSAEITCRLRPKSGAGLLRFLQVRELGGVAEVE